MNTRYYRAELPDEELEIRDMNTGKLIKGGTMKVTNETVLKWINENLGETIRKAIKDTPYSEELIAGIVMREVGTSKLMKFIREGRDFDYICKNMKGDWRWGKYHGFGFWQIDTRSYPEFVKSGKWQDPYECCLQAIKCLEEKREQLKEFGSDPSCPEKSKKFLEQMIIASYNCGASNVIKAYKNNRQIDYYTYNRDYSKSVLEFAEQYKELFMKREKIDDLPIKPIAEITDIKSDGK